MHIVMVGDYPKSPDKTGGGVEAVILYLSQALQAFPDIKLEIVTLEKWGRGSHVEQRDRVNIHYVPLSKRPSRLSILDNISQMREKMLQLKPDIVHAHITSEYALAAIETGLPWLLTLHGIRYLEASLRTGLLNRYRGWFVRRDEFKVVQAADPIISISPFIKSAFNGQIRGRIYDIENPISEQFFNLPNCAKPFQLLYVGRLTPRKDIMTLLQAFNQLRQRLPQATLRLAGGSKFKSEPDDYHLALKDYVQKANLEESVTFLGHLSEAAILEEYANCSVVVLSSKLETAPMAVMQAMAAGKPVVSTDAGGARYLVEDGQTGYIVPIGASSALAEALHKLLSQEADLAAMSQRAKIAAEKRFRASVVAQRTREVYYEMLGKTPTARVNGLIDAR